MKVRDVFGRLMWGSLAKQIRHRLTAGILILVLLLQFGCASSGSDKKSASSLLFPVPRAVFQELGKVGVTSGRFAPAFNIDDQEGTPKTFGPTLKEALMGALPLPAGLMVLTAIGLLVMPWLIYQAMMAEPTVKTAECRFQARRTPERYAVAGTPPSLSRLFASSSEVQTNTSTGTLTV